MQGHAGYTGLEDYEELDYFVVNKGYKDNMTHESFLKRAYVYLRVALTHLLPECNSNPKC